MGIVQNTSSYFRIVVLSYRDLAELARERKINLRRLAFRCDSLGVIWVYVDRANPDAVHRVSLGKVGPRWKSLLLLSEWWKEREKRNELYD